MDLGDLPVLAFGSAPDWHEWLAGNAATAAGVWLKTAKKGAPEPTISYAEALEEALCYGWIDGQKGPLDEHYWLQRFTPRKPGSKWSKINTDKATTLIETGRMQRWPARGGAGQGLLSVVIGIAPCVRSPEVQGEPQCGAWPRRHPSQINL